MSSRVRFLHQRCSSDAASSGLLAVDLLPVLIASVTPNNASIEWKGACFHGNEARFEITGSDRDVPGLHLKISRVKANPKEQFRRIIEISVVNLLNLLINGQAFSDVTFSRDPIVVVGILIAQPPLAASRYFGVEQLALLTQVR